MVQSLPSHRMEHGRRIRLMLLWRADEDPILDISFDGRCDAMIVILLQS